MFVRVLSDPYEDVAAHVITLEVRLDSTLISRLSSRISVEDLQIHDSHEPYIHCNSKCHGLVSTAVSCHATRTYRLLTMSSEVGGEVRTLCMEGSLRLKGHRSGTLAILHM